jgi:FkbM family methyltransferase
MIQGQSLLARSMEILKADPAELVRLMLGKARRLRRDPAGRTIGHIGRVRFEFDFELTPTMSMIWRRTYQPEVVIAMRRFLGEGATFVDVGANIGYFAAVGADLVGPSGKVIAIEPVHPYAERLRRLRELNPSFAISVHAVGVGEKRAPLPIFINEEDNIGANSFIRPAVPQASSPVVVQVIRLDELLTDHVDLIKIDVEGYEIPALRGLGQCLPAIGFPPILCEFNPAHYDEIGCSLDDVADWLDTHEYEARDVLSDRPVDILALDALRDVVLTHAQRR